MAGKEYVQHFVNSIPSADVSFDADAFDIAIRSQGAKLVHYSAQRCPVGLIDLGDIRRPHPHHEGCANGFIYSKVGTVTALMTSNNKRKGLEDVGFVDFSTVQTTFPMTYDDSTEPFIVAPFDRFYLADPINVVMWQLFQHHESGKDKLKYPIEQVLGDIIDSRGERYKVGIDFEVCGDGSIDWIGRQPTPELDLGPGLSNGFSTDRGMVCSIRYLFRPYWYVGVIPHEVRVSQIQSDSTGERKLTRMPQAAVLHREYVSLNAEVEENPMPPNCDAETLRQVMGPMYGGLGPK